MRTTLKQTFLKHAGFAAADITDIPSDVSPRHYARLTKDEKTYILMDSPLSENPAQFVTVDLFLQKMGVRVPYLFAYDLENGFVIEEDFGDDTLTKVLQRDVPAFAVYEKAIKALTDLQSHPIPVECPLPLYSEDMILNEALHLPDWYIQFAGGGRVSAGARADFIDIWKALIPHLMNVPLRVMLFDCHVDNLMVLKDGSIGFLDFQDAKIGPVTYDLLSLLEDIRLEVPVPLQKQLFDLYFSLRPSFKTDAFFLSYDIGACLRHTRVLGTFTKFYLEWGREKCLNYYDVLWRLLEARLNRPELADYKAWLNMYIPREKRGMPTRK